MDTRDRLKLGALWVGVLLLVVAALPLVAVGAWVLRLVVVAAAVIAVVSGCILYCVSPGFRHWAYQAAHHTTDASSATR